MIYGGTFDPIHKGHINTAINIQKHFNWDRFLFLPCKIPVLKHQALASAEQRVAMIKLALADIDNGHFDLDLSEINRKTPSYMVDTLSEFRQRLGEHLPITLIMGEDAFNQLPQWHAWEKLLTLANFLVIKRAGIDVNQRREPVKKLLRQHETQDKHALCQQAQGQIFCFDAGNFDFSSSWIRKQIAEGKNVSAYLSPAVLGYINQHHLYNQK